MFDGVQADAVDRDYAGSAGKHSPPVAQMIIKNQKGFEESFKIAAANGRQPFRSETNRTLSAAGSRR